MMNRVLRVFGLLLLWASYALWVAYHFPKNGLNLNPFSLGLSRLALFLGVFYFLWMVGKEIDSWPVLNLLLASTSCFILHFLLASRAADTTRGYSPHDLRTLVFMTSGYLLVLLFEVFVCPPGLDPNSHSSKIRAAWRAAPALFGMGMMIYVVTWSSRALMSIGHRSETEILVAIQNAVHYSVLGVGSFFFVKVLTVAKARLLERQADTPRHPPKLHHA